MSGYSLAIFDFDGTLIDTAPDIAKLMNAILVHEHGMNESTLEDVKSSIGWGVHELVEKLAAKQSFSFDRSTVEAIVTEFKSQYRINPVDLSRPYDGVVDMLSGDLSGIKKCIVTNKPHDITIQILELLDMSCFFESVIGMGSGFAPKPDPSGILKVMDGCCADPKDTVFIGDSNIDLNAAQRAGIDFVWMEYGYDTIPETKPTFTFSSAHQWRSLIDEYV